MHILQPRHIRLKPEEVEELLSKLNISLVQLPKIKINDPALPENCEISDVIKIEYTDPEEKETYERYRVVVV